MKSNIFFSIITVNLNNYQGLQRTIDSVSMQNCKDYEFIVVDGASIDQSITIIKECTYISKYIIERDNGIFDAMNKGIALSSGRYVITLNSGDLFCDANVLSRTKQYIVNNGEQHDIYFGNAIFKLNNKDLDWQWPFYSDINIDRWLIDYHPWHQASFVSNQIYNGLTYDSDYKMAGDNKFWTIVKRNFNFEYMGIDICNFELEGIGSSSISLRINILQSIENMSIEIIYKNQKNKAIITVLKHLMKGVSKLLIRKFLGMNIYYKFIRMNQKRINMKYIVS